jgi:hypothetical protein
MKLIGLGHVARSGKDTIADHLVDKHGFVKGSFIESMKEACQVIFGLTYEQLYGSEKEIVDPFWDSKLELRKNQHGVVLPVERIDERGGTREWERVPVTPRVIMQLMGTEAGRNVFGNDLWVHAFIRKITNSRDDRWVMADVRFPNEADAILKAGGLVYRVDRPGAHASNGIAAHPSETALLGYNKWSGVIVNDGSLEELYAKADLLLK